MINEEALRTYLLSRTPDAAGIEITKLGSGVQGSGFLVAITTRKARKEYVVKTLVSAGFGHDYPSDRAAVFLLDLDEYGNLDKHVKAVDVLAELPDGSVKPVGGGIEYYLMMEKAAGTDYFQDLDHMAGKARLDDRDKARIKAMASYLAKIHAVRKDSKTLYWRKLRDTVGHGECLMGVFDLYPDAAVAPELMTDIIKKSVDFIYRLKPRHRRLSQVHGDFHPGNIWFTGEADFILLDRSRGPWGEPADDLTALAVNYIFYSVSRDGMLCGAYREGLELLFGEYGRLTGDREINEVVAPFFAFRCAVVANPVFYPDLSHDGRRKMLCFARNVLAEERFDLNRVNEYLR
ncbi:MAG: hypothetical protein OHK006_24450 [Thermodesulfovibrionales bacterium]